MNIFFVLLVVCSTIKPKISGSSVLFATFPFQWRRTPNWAVPATGFFNANLWRLLWFVTSVTGGKTWRNYNAVSYMEFAEFWFGITKHVCSHLKFTLHIHHFILRTPLKQISPALSCRVSIYNMSLCPVGVGWGHCEWSNEARRFQWKL